MPTFSFEKRLSRIETLRLAIGYIGFMTELLIKHGTAPEHLKRVSYYIRPIRDMGQLGRKNNKKYYSGLNLIRAGSENSIYLGQ